MRIKLYNIEGNRWTSSKSKGKDNGYLLINPCELLFTYGSVFKDIFNKTEPYFFQLKGRQIIIKNTTNKSNVENLLRLAIDTGNKPSALTYDLIKDITIDGKLGIQYEPDEFYLFNPNELTLYK